MKYNQNFNSIKRHAAFYLVILIVLFGLVDGKSSTYAQITIPTATSLPTATLLPEQVVKALATYGLQGSDMPSGFVAASTNNSISLNELVDNLKKTYPNHTDLADSLKTLYQTYGVIGSSMSDYFVQPCSNQVVFGLGSWIRALPSADNATKLTTDTNLAGIYLGLLNWRKSSLTGLASSVYETDVPSSLCASPSTHYIDEFAADRFIIAVSVYAPNTTDRGLVVSTLKNMNDLLSERVTPKTLISNSINATPTSNPASTDGLPFLSNFSDNSQGWDLTADNYSAAHISQGQLLISVSYPGSRTIAIPKVKVKGDFYIEANVSLKTQLSSYIGFWQGLSSASQYHFFERGYHYGFSTGFSIRFSSFDGSQNSAQSIDLFDTPYQVPSWDPNKFTIGLEAKKGLYTVFIDGKSTESFQIVPFGNEIGLVVHSGENNNSEVDAYFTNITVRGAR